ncbi:MAG: hypothetical protein OJI67_00990, partial [Prosthecobacter sp.]|nr:hypothetical protein [Prosthecobacter sp.]
GWVLPSSSGWVIRDRGEFVGTNRPVESDPILTVKTSSDGEKYYHVIPLNSRLVYPNPDEVINFDEKPLVPDSVKLVASYGQAIAYGRTSSWTVVLYLNAAGKIVGWTLILRGMSVDAQLIPLAIRYEGGITATPKGYQTDATLLNDIQRLISSHQIHPSRERPYLLLTDGHGSRLTSNLIRVLARNNIYCVIEPSHTSTFIQTLDQQAMGALQVCYEKHLAITIATDPHSPLTLGARVTSLAHSIAELKTTYRKTLESSWARVGLPKGIIDPQSVKADRFKVGFPFRGSALPSVKMIKKILNPENICAHPTADIHVSFTEEDVAWNNFVELSSFPVTGHTTIFSYFLQRSGDRRSSIGTLMWTKRSLNVLPQVSEDDIHSSSDDDEEPTEAPLLEVHNLPRGACGRISTADGRIISDPQVLQEIEQIERNRRAEEERRAQRSEEREISDALERPLITILQRLNLLPRDGRATKAIFVQLYTQHLQHSGGVWRRSFPLNGLRTSMVESLLRFVDDNRTLIDSLTPALHTSTALSSTSPSISRAPPSVTRDRLISSSSTVQYMPSSSSSSSSSSSTFQCPYCEAHMGESMQEYQLHVFRCCQALLSGT